MVPAQPPLPTIWNLLFQFSAGIHTSMSMLESVDGAPLILTQPRAGYRIAAD